MSNDSKPVPVQDVAETPTVQRVPWKPIIGIVFVLVVFYLSQLFAGAGITIYGSVALHKTTAQLTAWLNDSIGAQFAYILAAESLAIGAIYLFLRHYKLSFAAIGLGRPRLKYIGYGIAFAPVYYGLYLLTVGIASSLIPGLNVDQAQEIGFDNVHGTLALTLTFISLVILPPLTEEIMVRGMLYSSFKKGLPVLWAILLTSLLFAAAHLPEGGAAGPLYIAALDTFVLSLVLIYLREKTGSLWSSITLHAIKNGVAFVALFVLHVH